MTDEQPSADQQLRAAALARGFACIGCGKRREPPYDDAELDMLRWGFAGSVAGYCGSCTREATDAERDGPADAEPDDEQTPDTEPPPP